MMEAVSLDPNELSFDGAYEQVQTIDDTFLLMANLHPFSIKAMEDQDIGPIMRPLTGMSSQLGIYQRTGGRWFKVRYHVSVQNDQNIVCSCTTNCVPLFFFFAYPVCFL